MNNSQQHPTQVLVTTSARIHMGFFDLNGQSARRFGSLGLALDAPFTKVSLAKGDGVFGDAPLPAYAEKCKHTLLKALRIDQPVSMSIHESIPRHFGLGSGTQMALAIGAGISQLFGLALSAPAIAQMTCRGARSGIGIGTFEQGGLVVDGGRGAHTQVPPIIARHAFPQDWRVLLILDHAHQGLHGEQETAAFKTLPKASYASTMQNGYAVLMQALPALSEQDLMQFGQAIAQLQAYTGRYFSPAQGGLYASTTVAQVLEFLYQQGLRCLGQTSWGPTGFAVFESEAVAQQWVAALTAQFAGAKLSYQVCKANNHGALITALGQSNC